MSKPLAVWILSKSEPIATNFAEFLSMEGFSCKVFTHSPEMSRAIVNELPEAILLDELNNRCAYSTIIKHLPIVEKQPKIVVLTADTDQGKTEYLRAHFCLQLPVDLKSVSEVLKSK